MRPSPIQTQKLGPWHGSIPAQVSLRGVLRIASGFAVLVTLHVATRYFGAAQWGAYVTASAIIVLFTVLEDFGLETVVARQIASDASRRDILFSASLALRLILAVAAVALSIGITAAVFAGRTTLLVTVVALAPILLADAVQSASASTLQAASRTGLIGVAELLTTLLSVMSILAAEHWHLSLGDFAGLTSAAALIGAVVSIGLALRRVTFNRFSASVEWPQLLRLTLPFGAVLLISTAYAQIDTLILAVLKPSRDVGFYGVATLITQLAMSGPSFFMAALLPMLAVTRSPEFDQAVRRALDSLLLWFVPPLIAGVLLAGTVVSAVAGGSFHAAAVPLTILLAGTLLTLPTAAFGNALVAERQESRLVRVGLIVLVVNIVLNLVLVPLFGIVGASAALVSTEALALVLTTVAFLKLHVIPLRPNRSLEIVTSGLAPVLAWALIVPTRVAGAQPVVRLTEVIVLAAFLVATARMVCAIRRRQTLDVGR